MPYPVAHLVRSVWIDLRNGKGFVVLDVPKTAYVVR